MGQPRCPVCNRFGQIALGGYCKNCHPNADDDDKSMFSDFPSSFDNGEFIPGD